jgi:hypothetical protein
MKHTNSSRLWSILLLLVLLGSVPLAKATASRVTCVQCNNSQHQEAQQVSSTPTSLKKSVSRISGGMVHLRQQVIQQNKTGKAQ